MMRSRRHILVLLLFASPAHAQLAREPHLQLEEIDIPTWSGAPALLGINAVLGGISAGIVSELRGGRFLSAFAAGAAGGSFVFLGKHVAARQFEGAGLLGRQLVSVGAGMVRNAGDGLAPLDRIDLSLGPADLTWDARTHRVSARIDPIGAVAMAMAASNSRLVLDRGASLSAGTPVFRAHHGFVNSPWSDFESCGLEIASVILIGECHELGPALQRRVFAHERVHAVQAETFQAYWGRPLLEWLLPESAPWPRLRPFLDVNLGEALVAIGDRAFFARYGSRPWEIEAEALAVRGK